MFVLSNGATLPQTTFIHEFSGCGSFLVSPAEPHIIVVTVIVSQVAQLAVSSCLWACHSRRNCTSCTCPSAWLLSFSFFFSMQGVKIILRRVICDYCATRDIFRKVYLVRRPFLSAKCLILSACGLSNMKKVYERRRFLLFVFILASQHRDGAQ